MASRLPKPKIEVKKEMDSMSNITSTESSSSLKLPKSTNSTATLKDYGKSKSGINLKGPALTKENKMPTKSTVMERSKTMATISRPNIGVGNATRVGVKRAGTQSTNPIETKRPNIRPITRATASNNVGVSGKSLKPMGTTATTKTLPTKVSKWDWKTKYEIVIKDFSSLKDKHKEALEKLDKLQIIVDDSTQNQNANINKIEMLQTKNNEISLELTKLNTNVNDLTVKNEKLEIDLKHSQLSLEKTSEDLNKHKELCKKQEKIIDDITKNNTELKLNLDNEIKIKNALTLRADDLQQLLHQMDKNRRILHNTIQEMKGNIRVFCRVRPKIQKEIDKPMCTINYIDECTLEIARSDNSDSSSSCGGKARGTRQEFSFDKVFPPTATQSDIFEELSMLVQSALEGYNVCVFAYGQTGSGKTYTMEGSNDPEYEGMIPRTVRHIFKEMKEFQLLGWEYKIEASFLEIYNEHIVDLLDFNQKSHEIRMVDSKSADLYVTNLFVEEIESPEELHECLKIAQQNRAVAATKCNERSSRSHSVARIRLIGTNEKSQERSVGNLNLVDLAGSERLKGDEVARQTETKNINKSLANLGNVILALLKKQDHVPYRNSKLTHLLMPSLGGNSKTLMLLNISPLDDCYNETLNSLRFASNVNSCKTGNIKRSKTMLQ
ncbi:hypothetical protein PV327_010476 [Microctonus hyperodae]|uniref:Kinesin motor domain-containing protein n=1 Tax=Microctonus hyperodae TaxID=165561 RepID=A0AA39FSD2_MICHY|nr:hypothetical protein PV327_010476 [Microctonus hyperodae]